MSDESWKQFQRYSPELQRKTLDSFETATDRAMVRYVVRSFTAGMVAGMVVGMAAALAAALVCQ